MLMSGCMQVDEVDEAESGERLAAPVGRDQRCGDGLEAGEPLAAATTAEQDVEVAAEKEEADADAEFDQLPPGGWVPMPPVGVSAWRMVAPGDGVLKAEGVGQPGQGGKPL